MPAIIQWPSADRAQAAKDALEGGIVREDEPSAGPFSFRRTSPTRMAFATEMADLPDRDQ